MANRPRAVAPFSSPAEIDSGVDIRHLGLHEKTIRLAETRRSEIGNVLVYYSAFMAIQLAKLLSEKYGTTIQPDQCEVTLSPMFTEDGTDSFKSLFRVTIDPGSGYQEYWTVEIAKNPDGTINAKVPAVCKDFTEEWTELGGPAN